MCLNNLFGKVLTGQFLTLKTLLAITHKIVDQVVFKVIPKRWIVERTFAWFNNFRSMSKDYEHNPKTSEHIVYINMYTELKKSDSKISSFVS